MRPEMRDEGSSARQLVAELEQARQRIAESEASQARLRRSLEAERRTRLRLEQSLASAPDGILLLDEEGRFSYVNPALLVWLGREEEDFIGRTLLGVSPPIMDPDMVQSLADKVEKRMRVGGRPAIAIEAELMDKDGKPLPISYSSAVITDEEGDARGEVVFLRDITERRRAEEKRRESEDRYRTVVATMTEALVVADKNDRLIYVNDTCCDLLGYSREELVGHDLAEFLDVTSLETLGQERAKRREGKSGRYEIEAIRKDGQTVFLEGSGVPMSDSAGTTLGTFGVFTDVTEHKRAEQEIASLAKFPDENPNPVLRVRKDGTVLYANQHGLRLLDSWGCRVGERLPDHSRHLVSESITSRAAQELEIETKGQILSLVSAPVVDAGYVNLYGRDITERVQAEEALRRSLDDAARGRRLVLALSQAAEAVQRARAPKEVYSTVGEVLALLDLQAAILTLTDDEQHLTVSHTTLQLTLLQAAQKLTGLSAQGYRFPLVPDSLFRHAIDKGEPVFAEAGGCLAEVLPRPLRRLAGPLTSVLGLEQIILAPLTAGGQPHGLLAAFGSDLTEADLPAISTFASQMAIAIENARLYEAAAKRIDQLSDMLMSHELRAPLTNIKAAAQTWQSLVSGDDILQQELVAIVNQQSDRLAWFLDKILGIATLESGIASPEWQQVSARSLLLRTADASWLPDHAHRLEVQTEEGLTVRVDEGWTVMAIRNLVENAIKHSPPGSHIELRASRIDQDWAQITVSDDGPGIAAQDLERIFEKFYRGQNAIDSGVSGHGLGLYLVKLLVEGQGGRVWVKSKVGKGTTVSLSLPLAD